MNPLYHKAYFTQSAQKPSNLPGESLPEIAFAGRSNAGKSSALNTLAQQKSLARTSKTPGRTQLINFFALDEVGFLVDLPGYGFAKVPESVKREWTRLIEHYFSERRTLRGLILLMDVRHPLKDMDWQIINWCGGAGIPLHILLTKADKLKRGAASKSLQEVKKALKEAGASASIQLFSAPKREGVDQAHAVLDEWFGLNQQAEEEEA